MLSKSCRTLFESIPAEAMRKIWQISKAITTLLMVVVDAAAAFRHFFDNDKLSTIVRQLFDRLLRLSTTFRQGWCARLPQMASITCHDYNRNTERYFIGFDPDGG